VHEVVDDIFAEIDNALIPDKLKKVAEKPLIVVDA